MTPDDKGHGPVSEQTPVDDHLTLQRLPKAATGLPAVVESFRVSLGQAGVARTARTFMSINQRQGFDCPSCAWADPEQNRHAFEFCENGAKAVADEAGRTVADAAFFARHSVEELSRQSDHWLNAQGRITQPVVLRPDGKHYEPIEWDDAFALVAAELQGLSSPDEAVFYTSGKASNEAAFLYQLMARMLGTNNLPDCSNMCHESSGRALTETIGVGKSTVTLGDLEAADCILVLGQNPGTNHPRMLTSLLTARRKGATIIAINPLREVGLRRFKHPQEPLSLLGSGTTLADPYLQIRINGDTAVLKGIMKALLEREDAHPGIVFDRDFVRDYTAGFEDLLADLQAADWTVLEEGSGVTRAQMTAVAEIIGRSKGVVACWAMGLTQHKNAVSTIRELVNLLLLRGSIGRPAAGLLCVRGHSNVQGDRTMGIWEKMPDPFLDRLGAVFEFVPPRQHGFDTVGTIKAMVAGQVRVFTSLGGNFLSATPDTTLVAQGLQRCALTVSIATKLNRSHLVSGRTALILPCLGRTERDVQASGVQFVTVENTVSAVSTSAGPVTPASAHLRSEVAIVAGLAAATLKGRQDLNWGELVANYDRIRDYIAQVVPGFENFNERVRQPDGFYAPVPARERIFRTPDGKARFTVNPLSDIRLEPDQYLMMTIRTHDQFNTTIYGLDDRYRGIIGGRRVIFMNQKDMDAAGFKPQQPVDITSHFHGQQRTLERFLAVPYDIPRRCTATYFPETNPLVSIDSTAEGSNTPASKSVVITLQASVTS